jgi:hypothetical protein
MKLLANITKKITKKHTTKIYKETKNLEFRSKI